MHKSCYTFVFVSLFSFSLFSQNNVGIGTITPNVKSLLDLSATDKGLLVPRVNTLQRLAINPSGFNDAALLVYDTDQNLFYFWNSTQWVAMPQPGGDNLSLNFNTNTGVLSLTDGAGTLTTTIPPGGDNLSLNFNTTTGVLSLTDGAGTLTTTIPPDNDNNPTNEIQQLSLNGSILNLSISNNSIDLSSVVGGTDSQTLSLSGQTLSISNGNSVVLTDNVDDADNDPLNELQTIAATVQPNNTDIGLSLSPAGNSVVVNDGDWQFNGTTLYNTNGGNVRIGSQNFPNQCGGVTSGESANVKFASIGGFASLGNFNNDPNFGSSPAPPTTWTGGVGSLIVGMNRSAGTSNVDFWNSSDPNNGFAALTDNDRGFDWRNFRNVAGLCTEQLLMSLSGSGNLTLNQVNGVGGSVNAFAYNTISDKRAKTNIKSLQSGSLAKLMLLNPVEYNYVAVHKDPKADLQFGKSATGTTEIGFIAQELHKVYPHLVNKPANQTNELWSVDYSKLTPILVKAIQEQQAEIEALKAQNAQLQHQSSSLQSSLETLYNRIGALEKAYSLK